MNSIPVQGTRLQSSLHSRASAPEQLRKAAHALGILSVLILIAFLGVWVRSWEMWPVASGGVLLAAALFLLSRRLALLFTRLSAREGQSFGAYTLVEKLGEGGMGEVWRACHSTLPRPAAIKMIPSDLMASSSMGDQFLHRFEREARATAGLQSAHTVTLFDFGLTADGSVYYVMELLEGINLETLIERFGPVSPSRAVAILTQACLSLAEAHGVGLIHRDIKPANLQICRLGVEVDFVKVLDFGLVSAPPQEENLNLTAPASVFGTPGFMSPEQAGGEPLDLTTDIYALGCVGYWLLTGQLVFSGDAIGVDSLVDLYRRVPSAPSRHSPHPLPRELDEIILSCLAKRPLDRPPSAMDLWERLRVCPLEDSWSQRQARDWWGQHLPPRQPARVVGEG